MKEKTADLEAAVRQTAEIRAELTRLCDERRAVDEKVTALEAEAEIVRANFEAEKSALEVQISESAAKIGDLVSNCIKLLFLLRQKTQWVENNLTNIRIFCIDIRISHLLAS
jgi:hypothetical protein